MPTNKQRRQAAQRHLQSQLERRAELARKRRRNLRHRASRRSPSSSWSARLLIITGVFSGDDDKRRRGRPRRPPRHAAAPPPRPTPTARSPAPTPPTTRATRTSRTSARRPTRRRRPTQGTDTLLMSTDQGDLDADPGPGDGPLRGGQLHLPGASRSSSTAARATARSTSRRFGVLQCGDPTGTGTGGPTLQVRRGGHRRGRPTRAAPSRWPTAAPPAPPAASSSCASSTPSSPRTTPPVGTVDEAGLAVLDTDRRGGQRRLVRGPGRRRRPEAAGHDQHDDRRPADQAQLSRT